MMYESGSEFLTKWGKNLAKKIIAVAKMQNKASLDAIMGNYEGDNGE